ncbi:hypothetical protein F9C28_19215 [Shimwellia pseudoproteus]|uniref:hypothetical protein n=1 Tax=Shimwellia pseudoproteus TaxID=570012 RepID=UPI0018EE43EC|nr:hypothetical protein [Shimwellia pseudoproteus]MBJ3816964.1 hypothetical protein [Shimwellia pseudoproteus]
MRELSERDIQQVSGAGAVSNLLNGELDAPARNLGTSLGSFAGNVASQSIHAVTHVASEVFNSVTSFIGNIFSR